MSIQTDIASLAENTLAINQVVEGDNTTTVTTPEGNSIKSVAKTILEGSDAMAAAVVTMENDGAGAVALAEAEKDAAIVAKDAAETAQAGAEAAQAAVSILSYPSVTALTGGGATALDGQSTFALGSPVIVTSTIVVLTYGRVGQWWKLIAGTDAESTGTGVVRPDDYDASTNARIWVQL